MFWGNTVLDVPFQSYLQDLSPQLASQRSKFLKSSLLVLHSSHAFSHPLVSTYTFTVGDLIYLHGFNPTLKPTTDSDTY